MVNGGRAIVWFRRDLRLADNRTLARAVEDSAEVVPLFIVDDRLWSTAGANRRWFLAGCLADLDRQLAGRLVVRRGDPPSVIEQLVRDHQIDRVYRAADAGAYGRRRDAEVDDVVNRAGARVLVVDHPGAVPLASIRTTSGQPFQVFTAYWRRWQTVVGEAPQPRPAPIPILDDVESEGIPDGGEPTATGRRPEPGEAAAHRALDRYASGGMDRYAEQRDLPAADATSRLSPYLKYGCLHPRQILALLDRRDLSHSTFAKELAWRDFYADVLYAWPESAWRSWNPALAGIEIDTGPQADRRFDAWCAGRTGYPLVDAGMRQLVAEGFMHNRVRMVVASFLVKDLHLDWTRGARFFLQHLFDGDLPSNNHGWQWAAGTGTDAAPYVRVFNPIRQSERFDPDGEYLRRWLPELATLDSQHVHAPWLAPDGPPAGYPLPIVDHATERAEALRRFGALARP